MNYATAIVRLPLVKESQNKTLRTPEDVHRECEDMANLAQESFHVLMLTSKNGLINRQMVTLGLADASLVHPREVFREAVRSGACAIVLAHNHPSGDVTPSAEDVRITRQLIDAGKIVDIKVIDHVIIGRNRNAGRSFLSMREEGLCDFS